MKPKNLRFGGLTATVLALLWTTPESLAQATWQKVGTGTGSLLGGDRTDPEDDGQDFPGAEADLAHAAERLAAAERPVIYAGGGARAANAWDELPALAEALGAPMVASTNGKGAFDDRHDLATMPLAHHELMWRTDCVLFVGSRTVSPRSGALKVHPDAYQIALNIDEASFGPPRRRFVHRR